MKFFKILDYGFDSAGNLHATLLDLSHTLPPDRPKEENPTDTTLAYLKECRRKERLEKKERKRLLEQQPKRKRGRPRKNYATN